MIPPHKLPSEEEIRAMDGPALTRLAFELGLAPENYALLGEVVSAEIFLSTNGHLYKWEPHADIAQAREVFFDLLKEKGFISRSYSGPGTHGCERGFGRYEAFPYAGAFPNSKRPHVEILWGLGEPGNPAEETEALALLRCACLAVAAQQREEANHAPA